jgi:galactose mutarotase-like enzyme
VSGLMDRLARRHGAPLEQTFGFIELRGAASRVTIYPALGGKIGEMEIGGRQWLWRSDVMKDREPVDGASYVETADTGGYDECFPTVAACTIPGQTPAYGGLALPDHGELWSQRAEVELTTPESGPEAATRWLGRRMPYRFERIVRMAPAGEVEMRYAVTNDGKVKLPFLWSSHPLLPLTPETHIILPEGAPVRVYQQHGIELFGGGGASHRWPRFRLAKKIVDMSRPDGVKKAYACKLFLEGLAGTAAVEEGSHRLEVRFDAAEVPNFGLWINRHGWTPFKGKKPYLNMGFEPCIGAPDTLSEALGTWKGAHWLAPGETRRWTLVWRAHART